MKYGRVFFIIPDLKGYFTGRVYPHPGVGFLGESLESVGVEYDVLDMYLGYDFSDLELRIRSFKPDLIGVTVYSFGRVIAYDLIARIREISDVPIIIGGPHVSLIGAEALQESGADLAIRNEGEQAIAELCLGKPLSSISNLIFKENGNIVENEQYFIDNLDNLRFPTFRSFELEKYIKEKIIAIVSSRGCPFHCIYCSVQTTMGRKYRFRCPENILSEIRYWYEKGYRTFDFNDDSLLQIPERVYKLCDLIEREGVRDVRFDCSQGTRANKVDEPLLKRMKEVGFQQFGFGVESANNKILKFIKKGQTIEQVDRAVRITCGLNLKVTLFFMVGLPGETVEDVERSFAFALKYPIQRANFYNIIPYPHTEMYDWLKKNNCFVVDPEVYLNDVNTRVDIPFFYTPTLSVAERKRLLAKGRKVTLLIYRHYKERQLKGLGFFGKIIAWVLSIEWLYFFKWRLQNRNSFWVKIPYLINDALVKIAGSHPGNIKFPRGFHNQNV